ncbi:MAG: sodium:calcium antiporter [Candidatus Woesebacteria bacterium]|jgi:cation:H+ antiporter
MDYLALALGLVLLSVGANYFVDYAVGLAKYLRIQTVVFGAIIVAIGTSLPELIITIGSAFSNNPEIIVGDIMGSNIANVGLVLGLALLLGKISPTHDKLDSKNVLLIVVTLVFVGLLLLRLLFWPIGVLLLGLSGFLILGLAKERDMSMQTPDIKTKNVIINWSVLISCLIGVIVGSQITIDSSLAIAKTLDISVGVVAATIIAIGTSLPELVITLMAIRRKEHGLAVGNVIGSNLFNLVLIGGVGATMSNLSVEVSLRMVVFFLSFALVLYMLASGRLKPNRFYGIALLVSYIIYVVLEYV